MPDRHFAEVSGRLAEWLRADEAAGAGAPVPPDPPVGAASPSPLEAFAAGFRLGRLVAQERYAGRLALAEERLRQAEQALRRARGAE